MALPKITQFLGYPVTEPWDSFYDSLYDGVLQTPTATQIVVSSEFGQKIVFTGSFTVSGGSVTGGTMTGFEVFAGTTKVMQADGFAASGAALFAALQNFQVDDDDFFDLLFDQALRFIGSKQDDELYGSEFDDVLAGRAGNDELFGWTGNDVLKGGKGNDLLAGDDGFDKLIGGDGDDVFGFFVNLEAPVGFSKIKDFTPGEDLIGLSVFDNILPPGFLGKEYFHKGTEATTAEQMVIYTKATGQIFFDADGSGAEAQVQFAKVKPGTKLNAGDFFVDNFFPV